MRYMLTFCSTQDDAARYDLLSQPEQAAITGDVVKWFQKYGPKAVSGEKLGDASTATTVRFKKGSQPVLTDGPFIEGKEIIGGFTVVDVPDLDEALKMAKEWPANSIVEVRPVDPNAPRLV
jgi:hypothetical protein